MPATAACTNEEKVPVTVQPMTAGGKPAPIDGGLTITVLSGDGTVEQVAGALAFNAVSGTSVGDTVFLIEADADLGAGVTTIGDRLTLTVTAASAVSLGISVGAAIPK